MIESYDFSKGKGMKREDQKVQKCTTTYFWLCVESYHTRVRVDVWRIGVKTRGGVFTNMYDVCFKNLNFSKK